MSNIIEGRVFKHSKTQGMNRFALVCIADNADEYGHAWPGTGTIAEKLGLRSRASAAVRIDALSQTNELAVYPKAGGSHHYLVLTAMSLTEAKSAVSKVAKKLKMSTAQLARLRRSFEKEAAERIDKKHQKKRDEGDTPSIQVHDTPSIQPPDATLDVQVGDTPSIQGVSAIDVHEPSLTVIEPSEPANEQASNSSKPKGSKTRQPDEMFDAIVKVCQMPATIPGSYVAKTKKALVEMGKTSADVLAFEEWWAENDWRGKKGQKPTQHQLVTDIEKSAQPYEYAGPKVIRLYEWADEVKP